MPEWLSDPAVQVGLAPFAVALALGLAAQAFGAARFMGLAIGAGFLVAYGLFEGVADFPPPASKQKVFYLVAFGLAAGLAIDLAGRSVWVARAAIVGFPLACALWLAWRRLGGDPSLDFLAALAGYWIGAAIFLARLAQLGAREGPACAGAVLIAAALAASGVAALGSSISLALLAAAVAAATGGATLWSYGAWLLKGQAGAFGQAALLGGGGALVALAGVMTLYAPQTSKVALVLIVLVAFADLAVRPLSGGTGMLARASRPVIHGVLAAIPALAALGLATLMQNF